MACVDIKTLPLQLLLRHHPDWEGQPVAVVDKDKPQGVILWANGRARDRGIVPGMRYATGLSLSRDLCGAAVSETEIGDALTIISHVLWSFSPRLEPSADEAGIVWLDASGLFPIYPSLEEWAGAICQGLREKNFYAVVAVGFSRFGTYAAAKASTRNIVFQDPDQERAYIRGVPIGCVGDNFQVIEKLLQLGITTLGQFGDLPVEGIRKRFGPAIENLHRAVRGDGWSPLNAGELSEPIEQYVAFDWPEENSERLLFKIAGSLPALMTELRDRHQVLETLELSFILDDRSTCREEISPATPTRDTRQLLQLVRLRLESLSFSSGVMEIVLHAVGVSVFEQQLELPGAEPGPNLEDANRAFAAIRADLGNDAVVYAPLNDGHLPEAQYGWEVMKQVALPKPNAVTKAPLIRRVYAPPIQLPPRERHEPDGWLIAGVSEGPVEEVIGPQIVSGGWWMREVSRTYYYVRTRSNRWLWIYFDYKRRRWFLHGEVQ